MEEPENKDDNEREVEDHASDSSLSLSLTPPIPEENQTNVNVKNESQSEEISEHLISNSESIENDRSFQEIEICSNPNIFLDLSSEEYISKQICPDLYNSPYSKENSISNQEGKTNVQSILEEILGNEQFKSDINIESNGDESLNIFANIDLDDKALNSYQNGNNTSDNFRNTKSDFTKNVKNFEEILSIKDNTIAALTCELDSFRELSNTNTLSMVSATEYRQLQEDYHNKIMECNSAIIYKNDLIKQLSESLDLSVSERKELLTQVEGFKNEIAQLQEKLQETSKMFEEHQCNSSDKIADETVAITNISSGNVEIAQDILLDNETVLKLQEENKALKDKIESDKTEYENEIARLRDLVANIKCGSTEILDLKNELENKHSVEMEELRTYFEQKCADLEKNFSEEVFSQQSRKVSGSSSEADLNSDLLYATQPGPGPGGDNIDNEIVAAKDDIIKLKNDLNAFKSKIVGCDIDNITDEDLLMIKNDIFNFYKSNEEEKIKMIESKYLEEINNLKHRLDLQEREHVSISSAIQEVGSSGDFEINEVVQSYERRLQEQVTLAKIDIITALESQIQRLASNEAEDEEWPSELLQLRDRFSDKYENEIRILKEEHEKEINRLKDEHLKVLNGALERARRRSLRDGESLSKDDLDLIKERDTLKKHVTSLQNLLGELLKYFTQCEDELNNTLVDELLKHGFDKNLSQVDDDLNLNDSSATTSSRNGDSFSNIARVHIKPNFEDLINKYQADDSKDISIDLKNELCICLEKLKQDANAVLALTVNLPKPIENQPNDLEERISSLTKQLFREIQTKENFKIELEEAQNIVQTLEMEKVDLERQLDQVLLERNTLDSDLLNAKNKIAELIENGHKEIVSEGYGEHGHPVEEGLGDAMSILASLQEKARHMLAQQRSSADSNVLQLIEELCRVGEKIKEESAKDKEDLSQQVNLAHWSGFSHSGKEKIEAADKKYKTTQKFLEEQAIEREHERDDAQRQIEQLHEQLREKEKDKANLERVTQEAEHLEQQIHELTRALDEETKKVKSLELVQEEAVEKIKILRDIIRDLENQNEVKSKELGEYITAVERLECIINQQDRSIDELKQGDSNRDVSDVRELYIHINKLEGELQQLRINSELAGSEGTLRQIKLQVFDIEVSLDKKTRDLEVLLSTGSNSCSSPSEDMSVRELVRPQTPNTMIMDECEVPLQQLARLKEKLVRHSRAEETAIKRIRDLEMQVFSLKNEIEETQNEKEYMKKQIQEQLVLISDLQIRLDEQRIRAEHIEKQTNTSLESKIYDLQNEIMTLQEILRNKEKAVIQLETLLEETQKRLKDAEEELASGKDDDMLVEMQKELEGLRSENVRMKKKLSEDSKVLPNIVGNIISDKNSDIEKLREKLSETEKHLEMYTSLNLDDRELKLLGNLKQNGTSIEELSSIIDDQMRRYDSRSGDLTSSNIVFKKNQNDTVYLSGVSDVEISAIDRIGPRNLNYTIQAPLGKPNSTEIHKSTEKRVHFEDSHCSETLLNECDSLRKQLHNKEKIIAEYEEKLNMLGNLEEKISGLQHYLDETEKALSHATKTFEKEQQELREQEKKLGVELAEKKLTLSEREKKISLLQEDSKRKDEMCMKLAREKRELEKSLDSLTKNNSDSLKETVKEKDEEINKLKVDLHNQKEEIEMLKQESKVKMNELKEKTDELFMLKAQVEALNEELEKLKGHRDLLQKETEKNVKLTKELENSKVVMNNVTTEVNVLNEKMSEKRKQIRELKESLTDRESRISNLKEQIKKLTDIVTDRECEIEILNEDTKRYQNDLSELEDQIKKIKSENIKKDIQERDAKIEELTKETNHLQDLLNEKEKIISQMTDDTNQLHNNLVTIQTKMRETGNIIDLANRLKDEQKKTATLLEEIHDLKAKLMTYDAANMATSVDEITGKLRKELDYAAQIDSNILTAVSDQSLSSISESQDVEVYRNALMRTKHQTKQLLNIKEKLEKDNLMLEQKCSTLQQQLINLHEVTEKQKLSLHQTQLEDARLIEQLRYKLDSALDAEEQFGKQLEDEKIAREALQAEINELKKQTTSTSSESTKYKSPPNKEMLEFNRVCKDLEQMREEKKRLLNEMKDLRRKNSELENNIRYTKEMLILQNERNTSLEAKIQNLIEVEKELREELLRKKVELEYKLKEALNNKLVMDELEQENAQLMKQKSELVKSINQQSSTAANFIPSTVENLIKELAEKTENNKKKMQYIEKILNEKRLLEEQIKNNQAGIPFKDLVARSDYLFAKTLKLESIRKALIWQKRYLTSYLESHKRHCMIDALPYFPHTRHCIKKRSPKAHFRSAVFVIIVIFRMKNLVCRWKTGVRIAENINSRHHRRTQNAETTRFQVGQPVSNQHFTRCANPFKTGTTTMTFAHDQMDEHTVSRPNYFDVSDRTASPLASSNLVPFCATSESMPWSGATPPSKERRNNFMIGSTVLSREDLTPLRAPHLLSRFSERIEQIQENLGLAPYTNTT